jgi:hypothetical protein
MFKKFRSPGGTIHISNTSGHSAIIEKSFTSVHESLWRLALMEGAIPEDVSTVTKEYIKEKKSEQEAIDNQEREDIKALMRDNIINSPLDYLDTEGNLIYRKIVSLTKKTHKKDYFDSLWKEVVSEGAA